MQNYWWCVYTYLHRKALNYYIENCKYLNSDDKKELRKRAKIHDMDKLTMYVFGDKKTTSKYHRQNNKHHIKEYIKQYGVPSRIDILESIFDYECAALTKSDKPLNAYDTIKTYYSELMPLYEPFLKELHMNSSYNAITKEAIEYINTIKVDKDVIYNEINDYIKYCIYGV